MATESVESVYARLGVVRSPVPLTTRGPHGSGGLTLILYAFATGQTPESHNLQESAARAGLPLYVIGTKVSWGASLTPFKERMRNSRSLCAAHAAAASAE